MPDIGQVENTDHRESRAVAWHETIWQRIISELRYSATGDGSRRMTRMGVKSLCP